MKPLVSVVLATYNGEAFLRIQLDSLLAQTYRPLEIIAIDDCSTDNTMAILQEYAAKCDFLTVHRNDTNLGYIKNFERGCQLSKGEFISLCDQDDYWEKDKTQLSIDHIGNHSLLHCDSRICNKDLEDSGELISDRVNYLSMDNCLQLAVFCRTYGHALFFTRDLFEKAYPFQVVVPHDWWLSFMATINNGIYYLNMPLVKYRQHGNNVYGVTGTRQGKKARKKNTREKKEKEIKNIRERVDIFYATCPAHLQQQKEVLGQLRDCYSSFSLSNNWKRMLLFFKYQRLFLAVKKRSALANFGFCLKMFIRIK